MSISELKEDLKILKQSVDEVLEALKQITSNKNEKLEAVAAKIINELKNVIQECSGKEEILEALGQEELIISPIKTHDKPKQIGLGKYSYPNHGVGNAELGSSGNPKALTWPFGKDDNKSL